ncbi:tRNA pseudouridine38-40 synthase [Sporothrix brasiliensis 5110]|uniref:tRNA pseudouridine synthase 1 n=1 Tax=Sporothrix brasiliensis 5110 TaxID=1398154 RepID=A0A0C2FHI6_9PEZI|nr:tRNA pseudouridine38-40 synthase [Sporothrix brasiliensis 5110]KIH90543.1 tRNA pseudouridine38-40 synthase [Sporothrix brasiliensis 5110]
MAGDDEGGGSSGPKHSHNYRGANKHRSGGHGGHGGHGAKPKDNGTWRKDNRPVKRRRLHGGRNAENAENADNGENGEGKTWEARPSNMSIPFSAEEIAAEGRRPKRKVAVMIGYAGTGYRGMQINHDEKTIEGDLFAAFVAAGAIAKANADDPKKSSLVRCARTDKGVHAAGNVISLKLIVEDADVVDKINAALPAQIRVWGIQRTINSFSCYQACDSRWYEYLLPSYALLPPHPESFLGREMVSWSTKADEEAATAAAAGDAVDGEKTDQTVFAGMMERLDDVKDFWPTVDREVVAPILDALSPEVRRLVTERLHAGDDVSLVTQKDIENVEHAEADGPTGPKVTETTEEAAAEATAEVVAETAANTDDATAEPTTTGPSHKLAVEQALRDIKAAYMAAKRAYRVTPQRLQRLQEALTQFEGTRNFHNYTIQKAHGDASAKRHIKSFVVNPAPLQIRDTQWLSLKVHGQSFMMHQIRKMVAMAVMVTRCGTDPAPAMALSYGPRRISIPRAPGFGLLLERPVFDSYNARAQSNFGKAPLDFGVYETELRAFKDSQIYGRIWDVEETQNVFHAFFHQLDNFRTSYYLWAVPGGYKAAFERFGGQGGSKDGARGAGGPSDLLEDPDEDAENPDEGEG